MADGDSAKNLSGELANAIVKPVIGEVGQIAREVGQSFGLTANTPQDPQKKLLERKEEEKRKQNILGFINEQIARDKASLQRKQMETKQEEQTEEVKVEEKKVLEQNKKEQKSDAIKQAQTRVETKRGVGG